MLLLWYPLELELELRSASRLNPIALHTLVVVVVSQVEGAGGGGCCGQEMAVEKCVKSFFRSAFRTSPGRAESSPEWSQCVAFVTAPAGAKHVPIFSGMRGAVVAQPPQARQSLRNLRNFHKSAKALI